MIIRRSKFIVIIAFICTFCSSIHLYAQLPSSSKSKTIVNKQTELLGNSLNSKGLILGSPIFIRIFKESKELELWIKKTNSKRFELFKTYKICTYGWQGLGPKLKEGDGIAPEGFYYFNSNNLNPNSNYHLAFNIGYPNSYDKALGRTGSAIMIHGACVSIGCFAMGNETVEEIYTLTHKALTNDQKFIRVHSFPFRMNENNMKRYKNSRWISFWKNLKEGYDFFEDNKFPPNSVVKNGRYVFKSE
jgi:murein L,D-transpeptidase YafK